MLSDSVYLAHNSYPGKKKKDLASDLVTFQLIKLLPLVLPSIPYKPENHLSGAVVKISRDLFLVISNRMYCWLRGHSGRQSIYKRTPPTNLQSKFLLNIHMWEGRFVVSIESHIEKKINKVSS